MKVYLEYPEKGTRMNGDLGFAFRLHDFLLPYAGKWGVDVPPEALTLTVSETTAQERKELAKWLRLCAESLEME